MTDAVIPGATILGLLLLGVAVTAELFSLPQPDPMWTDWYVGNAAALWPPALTPARIGWQGWIPITVGGVFICAAGILAFSHRRIPRRVLPAGIALPSVLAAWGALMSLLVWNATFDTVPTTHVTNRLVHLSRGVSLGLRYSTLGMWWAGLSGAAIVLALTRQVSAAEQARMSTRKRLLYLGVLILLGSIGSFGAAVHAGFPSDNTSWYLLLPAAVLIPGVAYLAATISKGISVSGDYNKTVAVALCVLFIAVFFAAIGWQTRGISAYLHQYSFDNTIAPQITHFDTGRQPLLDAVMEGLYIRWIVVGVAGFQVLMLILLIRKNWRLIIGPAAASTILVMVVNLLLWTGDRALSDFVARSSTCYHLNILAHIGSRKPFLNDYFYYYDPVPVRVRDKMPEASPHQLVVEPVTLAVQSDSIVLNDHRVVPMKNWRIDSRYSTVENKREILTPLLGAMQETLSHMKMVANRRGQVLEGQGITILTPQGARLSTRNWILIENTIQAAGFDWYNFLVQAPSNASDVCATYGTVIPPKGFFSSLGERASMVDELVGWVSEHPDRTVDSGRFRKCLLENTRRSNNYQYARLYPHTVMPAMAGVGYWMVFSQYKEIVEHAERTEFGTLFLQQLGMDGRPSGEPLVLLEGYQAINQIVWGRTSDGLVAAITVNNPGDRRLLVCRFNFENGVPRLTGKKEIAEADDPYYLQMIETDDGFWMAFESRDGPMAQQLNRAGALTGHPVALSDGPVHHAGRSTLFETNGGFGAAWICGDALCLRFFSKVMAPRGIVREIRLPNIHLCVFGALGYRDGHVRTVVRDCAGNDNRTGYYLIDISPDGKIRDQERIAEAVWDVESEGLWIENELVYLLNEEGRLVIRCHGREDAFHVLVKERSAQGFFTIEEADNVVLVSWADHRDDKGGHCHQNVNDCMPEIYIAAVDSRDFSLVIPPTRATRSAIPKTNPPLDCREEAQNR